MIRRLLIALCALAVLPATGAGLGVNEVGRELKCPTCDTPLDVSNAPSALAMKEIIAERIAEGATKQQIIDEMVADFGREVLATPPRSGFDLVVWILPPAILMLGALTVVLFARGARRRAAETRGPPPSEGEAARLDELLNS